eukprot:2853793-Amphidinium_carterae.2
MERGAVRAHAPVDAMLSHFGGTTLMQGSSCFKQRAVFIESSSTVQGSQSSRRGKGWRSRRLLCRLWSMVPSLLNHFHVGMVHLLLLKRSILARATVPGPFPVVWPLTT